MKSGCLKSMFLAAMSLLPALSAAQVKIVVGITVEDLRSEYLQLFWNEFSDGGFKRLAREGTSYSAASYSFRKSDAAADYAELSTSASPFENGIAAAEYYDRGKKMYLSVLADAAVKPLGGDRALSAAGLGAPTLSDRLFERSYGLSKIVSVAPAPEAAILQNGHCGRSYWVNNYAGTWESSSYYGDALPGWVTELNTKTELGKYCEDGWQPLYPAGYYYAARGGSRGFDHKLKSEAAGLKYYERLMTTPFVNDFVCDFALEALSGERMGTDLITDLLLVGFTARPYFATEGSRMTMELEDAYLRLDKTLERLLSALKARFGDSEILVYLAGVRSSGSDARPEFINKNLKWKAFGTDRYYALLNSYLKGIYGRENLVEKLSLGNVYLNHKTIADAGLNLIDVQRTAADFMLLTEGVKTVATAADISRVYSSGLSPGIAFSRERSGDVVYTLQTNYYEEDVRKQFTGYAMEFQYPVPVYVYGRNVIPGQRIDEDFSIAEVGAVVERMMK